ncbi:MAG: hypothetical protein JWR84_3629 [Caulobacter sp.]|nr:hypothetical protein [Caulobacter sp.]
MRRLLPVLAVLVLTTPAFAADRLSDIAWMQGNWRVTQDDGAVVYETWLPAEGGIMPGVGRTVKDAKAQVEFMRIDERDGRIAFTAVLTGQAPTTFVAKSRTADEVVFENLEHDFPQRVIYRRCDADLCAAIEGTINGKPERMAWRYARQP